jgi:catechol 2,3-dioxygenase-like lactoylglutathione lyase family enzyme
MNIEFLSTVAVIAPDPLASRRLYVDALGLPLGGQGDGYQHSERIAGCKSFGIWPLSQAAEACFGTAKWPAERPVPQVSIEFDVTDAAAVGPAARELEQDGYELLHPPREGDSDTSGISCPTCPAISCNLRTSRFMARVVLEAASLQDFRGRSRVACNCLKIVVSPVRVRVSPSA